MEIRKDFDIAVVGDLNVDLILRGDVTPAFGQVEKVIDDAMLTVGSSSGIFAFGAARLGLRVAAIGKIGHDNFGQFMLDEMRAHGLDTSGVITDTTLKTGLGIILSRPEDRAILTYLGSIAALRYDEIDLSIVKRARHLHIGSYFLLSELLPDIPTLLHEAHQAGLTISLDTNYDPSGQWSADLVAVLDCVDIFLPNEAEACAIARADDPRTALNILAKHVPTVAVKRGAQGAIACQGGNYAESPSLPMPVVDTTGAGDSFDAGLIYGYLHGWELARMLHFACVCGALSTRGVGGTSAQPSLAEALATTGV